MLCQFSFQNFKSYKAETTFDFQAAAIPEFGASLLGEEKGGKLLPVGIVFACFCNIWTKWRRKE